MLRFRVDQPRDPLASLRPRPTNARICEEVVALRLCRERYLSNLWLGRAFISLYELIGPSLARIVVRSPALRGVSRAGLDSNRTYSAKPYGTRLVRSDATAYYSPGTLSNCVVGSSICRPYVRW